MYNFLFNYCIIHSLLSKDCDVLSSKSKRSIEFIAPRGVFSLDTRDMEIPWLKFYVSTGAPLGFALLQTILVGSTVSRDPPRHLSFAQFSVIYHNGKHDLQLNSVITTDVKNNIKNGKGM